jgi:hypothetical protein
MNILVGLVAIALIGATILVLFGKYVERSWNKIDEVPIEEVEIKKKETKRELVGEKTLEDWIAIAKQRGYKIGWAYHRFNARMK